MLNGMVWHTAAQHGMARCGTTQCSTEVAGYDSWGVQGQDTVPTSCSTGWSPRDPHTRSQVQPRGQSPATASCGPPQDLAPSLWGSPGPAAVGAASSCGHCQ